MLVPMLPTRFLDRAVQLFANKTGVVCGDRRFTYGEYFERVNRLSNALLEAGVKPGDRVAFLSFNCHRLLEAYYGVVQIGAVLLPLNIRLTPQDLAFILNDAEARALFVDKDLLPLIQPVLGQLEAIEQIFLLLDGDRPEGLDWQDYESLIAAANPSPPPRPDLDENDLAELFYTSGTTGSPKGVMLTYRNLYANAIGLMMATEMTDADVQLHTVPLFHVNGWGTPHALTAVGGTHVMIRQFAPQTFFELVEREQVTLAFMVPTMINALINYPDANRYQRDSVRLVLGGGAPTPPAFVKAVMEKFGWEFRSGYGLSETTPVLTVSPIKHHLRHLPIEEQYRLRAKTGLPVIGVDLRVVDDQDRDVARDGEQIGEIVVRGDIVMKGYWKRPEDTAAVMRNGWFHTGDMATHDAEGYVQIVDRKKDIIISGGENIASIEIENCLYAHPAVLEVAVIPVPDEKWGEVPKALVVLKPDQSASESDLIAHCRERIAHFKVPKSVEFVDALPKTGTGKIQKTMLREQYWQGYTQRVH